MCLTDKEYHLERSNGKAWKNKCSSSIIYKWRISLNKSGKKRHVLCIDYKLLYNGGNIIEYTKYLFLAMYHKYLL